MKLAAPFIQLPLLFDAATMAAEIEALGESSWMPHPQGFAGNSMLPLIAVDGDPKNESYAGVMSPTPYLLRCPYLMQVLGSIGVVLGRTRLMRLSGHAEVALHADKGYYWADRVRVHMPVLTQPTVRFDCGDSHVNMAAGECWIFDTWRRHRVLNDAEQSRIHLVADTVGGDRFWSMVGAGRDHNRNPFSQPWNPTTVAPDPQSQPELVFEMTNIPVVMTPWELTSRIGFLLAETVPHPNQPRLRQVAAHFCRRWQALWAAHGERREGWPAYRSALDEFMDQVSALAAPLVLQNNITLINAMAAAVGKIAVTGGSSMTSEYSEYQEKKPDSAMRVGDRRAAAATGPGNDSSDTVFERPIFIVSSPRSGSTLLFETLSKARDVYTIGGESHKVIEVIPELSPQLNGLGSNRLTADSASPAVVKELRRRFLEKLVDRDGRPASPGRLRMLEKTPKNSLRVPFLERVFPEGVFVYLYRDPREVIGSMIDAWQSGRFRTYPDLPGWQGPSWSLLLTPGWQELVGKPIADIVANQWETATRILLDDLERLPGGRVHVARYDALVADPKREIDLLCRALGLDWDRQIEGALPVARYSVSEPAPDKWRKHAALIEPLLERLQPTMDRAARFAAR